MQSLIYLASGINFIGVVMFIVGLSLLIAIHEVGHLSMAKLFNVYCQEFAIGMGPKLYSKKRKGGETTFSIRAIPLGGFVSMYGEGIELPEGINIPRERSLQGVKKWQRAIIMLAGIFLNFVLAFFLFLGNNLFFPQTYGTNKIVVAQDSIAEIVGLPNEAIVTKIEKYYVIEGVTSEVESINVSTYSELWGKALTYKIPKAENDTLNLTIFYHETKNSNVESLDFVLTAVMAKDTKETNSWSKIGISAHTYTVKLSFGEAIKQTCKDWWSACTLITDMLFGLFQGKNLDQVGGPIAILSVSSQALSYGFGEYLFLWGAISVNLALFNLLPFPGLDGWHFVVIIVESIFRKEIPEKVKNGIAMVGTLLLFALMIVIMFKDVFTFF